MKHATSRIALILALALAGAPRLAPAESTACTGPVHRISLPGQWAQASEGGVTSYRGLAATEGVTTAVYRLNESPAGDAMRREVMQLSVALGRAQEIELAGPQLALSAVTRERSGALMKMTYSGLDARAKRRFVSLTVSSRCLLQHFYYEAVGLHERQFAHRSREILGSIQLGPALAAECPLCDARLSGVAALPDLLSGGRLTLPALPLGR